MKEKNISLLRFLGIICFALGVTFAIQDVFQVLSTILLGISIVAILLYRKLYGKIRQEEETIYFSKIKPNAIIPTKRIEDGCYDLYACIDNPVIIPPHSNVLVPTGIASAFNPKYRIAFRERGSNTKSNTIIMAGQIDSGYRGEYFISVYNGNDKPVELTSTIEKVEKTEDFIRVPVSKAICQFAIEPVPNVSIKEIEDYELANIESQRGTGKLGSSNK